MSLLAVLVTFALLVFQQKEPKKRARPEDPRFREADVVSGWGWSLCGRGPWPSLGL